MKYITDILVDKITEYKTYEGKYEDSIKARILNYLRSFAASAYTSQPAIDAFTGKKVADADNGYTDGQYRWYESEIYYFDKYNLALNDDFVKYVASKA